MIEPLRSFLKNKIKWWILIAILAFIIRVAVIFIMQNWYDATWRDFGTIAISLLNGEGYSARPGYYWFTEVAPTAFQAPFQVFYFLVFYYLLGPVTRGAHMAIQISHSLISALTILPLYLVVVKLFGKQVAKIATLGFALYPPVIYGCIHFSALTWTIFFIMWILYVTLKMADNASLKLTLILGVLWGIVFLLYPVLSIFAPLSFLWILWNRCGISLKKMFGYLFIAGLLSLIILSPWTIRNIKTFDTPIIFISSFPWSLFMGNNELATGIQRPTFSRPFKIIASDKELINKYPFLSRLLGNNNEVGAMRQFRFHAVEFMKNNPTKAMVLFLKKIFYYWGVNPYHNETKTWKGYLYLFSYLLLMGFAITGVYLLISKRYCVREIILHAGLVFPVSWVYCITSVGEAKYRILIEPVFIIFAAYTFWQLIEKKFPHLAIKFTNSD